MLKTYAHGVYLVKNNRVIPEEERAWLEETLQRNISQEEARQGTITYKILQEHNQLRSTGKLQLKADALVSHDLTYVSVIQAAKAAGLEKFPVPYILTNCHNALCAMEGAKNGDDHRFGLSSCRKYGGIFVPPYAAVMHQYMREMYAECGNIIIGSDAHTRYGSLGTLGFATGGGELVKQLVGETYELDYPEVVAVYLFGEPQPGIGPQDVALALLKTVYANGYVKNKVMEFVGPGVAELSLDFRHGIDIMTAEAGSLSSVWTTDRKVDGYLSRRGRQEGYKKLAPATLAYYEGAVLVDLSKIEAMIALPYHPSNVYTIADFNAASGDILREIEKETARLTGRPEKDFVLTDKLVNNRLQATQGVIAGCAGGTYENVVEAAQRLKWRSCGNGEFSLLIAPASEPILLDLVDKGAVRDLMAAGAVMRSAACGPCYGFCDAPATAGFSVRHVTRNLPFRAGSRSAVALMDARSIAATAANRGFLTAGTTYDCPVDIAPEEFDHAIYNHRVYYGFSQPKANTELVYGDNIKAWPPLAPLAENLLLKVCAVVKKANLSTDDLLPTGSTAAVRSDPEHLADFTLTGCAPSYVGLARNVRSLEQEYHREQKLPAELAAALAELQEFSKKHVSLEDTSLGSVVCALKAGDSSVREQVASSQRVLGGLANICQSYALPYQKNLLNWGLLPFLNTDAVNLTEGDYLYIPGLKTSLQQRRTEVTAYVVGKNRQMLTLGLPKLTEEEYNILLSGSLINFLQQRQKPAAD